VQPELSPSGAVAVSVTISESRWAALDRLVSYVFAAIILGGGMFVPLGLAIYALFFQE
jgi:hypothetical protein